MVISDTWYVSFLCMYFANTFLLFIGDAFLYTYIAFTFLLPIGDTKRIGLVIGYCCISNSRTLK